jgi:transposase
MANSWNRRHPPETIEGGGMNVVHERFVGLDVHKDTVVACVLIREGGQVRKDIRTFATMTTDLIVLHDWLRSYGVTHVAMESTGVYWKPGFNLPEGDFNVILINATHLKRVPGRKTDVTDCEWIADLPLLIIKFFIFVGRVIRWGRRPRKR